MSESDWLCSTDSDSMLGVLVGKASDRKLRLFACACWRRISHRLPDPRWGLALVATERYVEREASEADLTAAREYAAFDRGDPGDRVWGAHAGTTAVLAAAMAPDWLPDRWPCVGSVVSHARMAAAYHAELAGSNRKERKTGWGAGYAAEGAAQCALLRDLFGNPFRAVTLDPAWLTSTVVALAHGIYANRAFDRLPILADALEDAGCDSADVLTHCRGEGPHVRGCWVVDLVLGKG